ncbi:MAG TPA: hypothetical protein VJB94_01910 [Candidatus Nanoarchaeia archaeon]|nr:hypothetical protein [Candidatus Nanoarchaeia archaeon]
MCDCENCNGNEFNEFLENFVEGFADSTFDYIWSQVKPNTREMKKREVARDLYSLGAAQMFIVFMNMAEMKENFEEKDEDI